jgi:hypothetical protein
MQACVAVDFYIISGSCVHLDEDGTRQEWETEAADWEMKYPCPIPTGCSPPRDGVVQEGEAAENTLKVSHFGPINDYTTLPEEISMER